MKWRAGMTAAVLLASAGTAHAQAPQGDWIAEIRVVQSLDDYSEDRAKLDRGGVSYGTWSSWFSGTDLPTDIRAAPLKTSTALGIAIDGAGRVSSCRVLKPSSDARLDTLACERLRGVGRFGPFHDAPGHALDTRLNVSVVWENTPRAEVEARPHYPAVPPPPPPGWGSDYQGWPRLKWQGGLRIDRFPDVQALYDAQPGKRATGITALEIAADPETGAVTCTLGMSSGDAALDKLACDTASALPLSYPERCGTCGTRRMPLQFVWRRKGSHIRVPMSEDPRQVVPRDPADPRPSAPPAINPNALLAGSIDPADYADFAGKLPHDITIGLDLTIEAAGRVKACAPHLSSGIPALDARLCAIAVKRFRFAPQIDAFGDPAGRVKLQYFRIVASKAASSP